ncbi:MAG: formylglycine-generating enzyme family protein [Candidatus Xenobia bacterium]
MGIDAFSSLPGHAEHQQRQQVWLPQQTQDELAALHDHASATMDVMLKASSAEQTQVRELISDLAGVGQVLRENKPIPTPQAAHQVHQTWGQVHAAANRIAESVVFALSGNASGAVLLAQATRQMQAGQVLWTTGVSEARRLLASPQVGSLLPAGDLPASDLVDWVQIPGGEFLYGRSHTPTLLPAFELSRTPVTNAQFAAFVHATGYHAEGPWQHRAGPGREQHPVDCVTYNDAVAFSRWVGGRLPTEAEWEKGARGTDGREYPWGNDWDRERCVYGAADSEPVGTHPLGDSPYGLQDASGNVLEWTGTNHAVKPGSILLKGGGWTNNNPQSFNTWRWSHDLPQSFYPGFGFRVARS